MISFDRIQSVLSDTITSMNPSDTPQLLILAGFPIEHMHIECEYLFSQHCTGLEEYMDKSKRKRMISEAVVHGNHSGKYWCTYEDYLLLNASVLDDFFDKAFIKLPYFKNLLPFGLTIDGEPREPEGEEDECATECLSPIFLSDETCFALEGRINKLYRTKKTL